MSTLSTLFAWRTADGFLVQVQGRGTMRESPALREFAARCAAEPPRCALLIDLTTCEYLDSTFLGCIVGIYHRSRRDQTLRLTLLACSETRRRLFGPTRLEQVFECVESGPAPLGEPQPLLPPELSQQDFGEHIMDCHHRLADTGCNGADAFRRVAENLSKELRGA